MCECRSLTTCRAGIIAFPILALSSLRGPRNIRSASDGHSDETERQVRCSSNNGRGQPAYRSSIALKLRANDFSALDTRYQNRPHNYVKDKIIGIFPPD